MSVDGHSNWKKEHGIVSNVCGFGLCLPHHGYFIIDGWSHVKGFNGMVGCGVGCGVVLVLPFVFPAQRQLNGVTR